ncbi:MAG: preprotein translocase subunit SecE [Tepidisphaeraceae bacterium]|jgi:preprotein translocase subunit SecE
MESTKIKPEPKDAMTGEQPDNSEDSQVPERNEPPTRRQAGPTPVHPSESPKPGYFQIYKKGQGYWTRMGTVAAVSVIGLLTANFLYSEFDGFSAGPKISGFLRNVHLQEPRGAYLVVVIFSLTYAAIAYHLMNKPLHVDFLIATDSEMKKVNWTTKKELMGSTKVVIWFMFIMAVLLFTYDLFFQLVFYLLGVLKTPPFFLGH